MQPPAQPPEQPRQPQPPAWHSLNYRPPAVRPVQPLTINGKVLASGWIVGITLIALMVLCGCFGSGYAMGMAAPSATATANARTHAQAGAVTQPAIPPTQTPAANPVVTATSAHPAPTATPDLTVLVVSGNGSKSTAAFTVRNTWQVSWNCTDDIYIVFYSSRTNDYADDGPIDFDCSITNSDSSIYHDSGTFYFNVISRGTWNITVTDLPN